MKILVDELPWFGDWCPFYQFCPGYGHEDCPNANNGDDQYSEDAMTECYFFKLSR